MKLIFLILEKEMCAVEFFFVFLNLEFLCMLGNIDVSSVKFSRDDDLNEKV